MEVGRGKIVPDAHLKAAIKSTIFELLGEGKRVGLLEVIFVVETYDVLGRIRVGSVIVILLSRQDLGHLLQTRLHLEGRRRDLNLCRRCHFLQLNCKRVVLLANLNTRGVQLE
jgi:hypothetical protein